MVVRVESSVEYCRFYCCYFCCRWCLWYFIIIVVIAVVAISFDYTLNGSIELDNDNQIFDLCEIPRDRCTKLSHRLQPQGQKQWKITEYFLCAAILLTLSSIYKFDKIYSHNSIHQHCILTFFSDFSLFWSLWNYNFMKTSPTHPCLTIEFVNW